MPGALKAIGALVLVAVVFIVAAIVGGGGDEGSAIPGAAPAPEQQTAGHGAGHRASTADRTPEELGYPEFATNNTTRVGGGDPASNAAAVALAVYPSATPAQRPDAVTFVNACDWQSAIAASVLMAAPVGAPLLISGVGRAARDQLGRLRRARPAGEPPPPTARRSSRSASAAAPGGLRRKRSRATGAAAAAAIAALRDRLVGGPPRHVVIASDRPGFRDARRRLGGPLRRPGALHRRRLAAGGDGRGAAAAPEGAGLRARPLLGDLLDGRAPDREDRQTGAARLRRGPGRQRDRPGALPNGDFGWNVNDPGHGFVVARSRLATRRRRGGSALRLGNLGAAAAQRRRRYAPGRAARISARRQARATRRTRPAPSTTTSG